MTTFFCDDDDVVLVWELEKNHLEHVGDVDKGKVATTATTTTNMDDTHTTNGDERKRYDSNRREVDSFSLSEREPY